MRLQVALGADARDLGRHIEQRVRDLAGDHVDLVVEGHGDDHVGLLHAGLGEHLGVGAVTDEAADVERIADRVDELRRRVDHRHVVFLGGQALGDAVADLSRTADDDAHGGSRLSWPSSADTEGLELAVQGRSLHADEFGGARDVAAEAVHLRGEVFALEDLARVAERQ